MKDKEARKELEDLRYVLRIRGLDIRDIEENGVILEQRLNALTEAMGYEFATVDDKVCAVKKTTRGKVTEIHSGDLSKMKVKLNEYETILTKIRNLVK